MCAHCKLFRFSPLLPSLSPTLIIYSSMAWNQHIPHKRWEPEEQYPQAGTHFHKFAKTQRTEFVRGDSSSSWTFGPKVSVGVAPYEGAAAKPRGSVALVKKTNLTPPLDRQTKRVPKRSRNKKGGVPKRQLRTHQILGPFSSGAPFKRRTELHRLQHRINFIQTSVGLTAAGYHTAEDLQRFQARISFSVQDMDAPGRNCSGETAVDFSPQTTVSISTRRWRLSPAVSHPVQPYDHQPDLNQKLQT